MNQNVDEDQLKINVRLVQIQILPENEFGRIPGSFQVQTNKISIF